LCRSFTGRRRREEKEEEREVRHGSMRKRIATMPHPIRNMLV
jgi:hypothetical protein